MPYAIHIAAGMLVAVAVAASTACQRSDARDDGAPADAATGGATPSTMEGMQGMEGMEAMGKGGMMTRMQAHMEAMHGVTGADAMQRMLPMHRQMTANMISEMNREMRTMNMEGDDGWTGLMDSVRQDLRDLPELNSTQLASAMPAHHQRVMRLMEIHRETMRQMK